MSTHGDEPDSPSQLQSRSRSRSKVEEDEPSDEPKASLIREVSPIKKSPARRDESPPGDSSYEADPGIEVTQERGLIPLPGRIVNTNADGTHNIR